MIQTYSQMNSVLSGNVILHGWILSADNFYFTDLPFMAGLSYIFGTSLRLVYIVPFFIFCLLILGALLLVTRIAETREQKYFGMFLVLFLIGMPFGPSHDEFFQSAIHIATITLLPYAILPIEPTLSDRKFNYWALAPFSVLIFTVTASDPFSGIFLQSLFLGSSHCAPGQPVAVDRIGGLVIAEMILR